MNEEAEISEEAEWGLDSRANYSIFPFLETSIFGNDFPENGTGFSKNGNAKRH